MQMIEVVKQSDDEIFFIISPVVMTVTIGRNLQFSLVYLTVDLQLHMVVTYICLL